MIDSKLRDEYRKRMEEQKRVAADRLAKYAEYNKAHKKAKE